MYYKGNLRRCEDYNAIVSYNESYKSTTQQWSAIIESEGNFYILKHPDYDGTYLTEVQSIEGQLLIDT